MGTDSSVSGSSRICIFVRHGESESNISHTWSSSVERFPLTEGGTGVIEETGRRLGKVKSIAGLYTSPVLRAAQTADIISRHLAMAPRITTLLSERSFGKYNNSSFADSVQRRRIVSEQIDKGYPDWESWDSITARIMLFSKGIMPGSVSVAVTHMDPIRAVVTHFRGADERAAFGQYIRNGSMSVIDFGRKGEEAVIAVDSMEVPGRL